MIFAVFNLSPLTVCKLQFFTFIFVVILPVLSRHEITAMFEN